VFSAIGLPTKPGKAFEITIAGERIESIVHTPGDRAQWLCFPPLVDLHVHANRAFTSEGIRPQSSKHAVELALELAKVATVDDYERNALRLFDQARQYGTSRLRTHADIGSYVDLKAVQGSARARERCRAQLEVEIVAFTTVSQDPAEPRVRKMLSEACQAGANLLGAVPDAYEDPRRSIDALLELAAELDIGVDVHIDEHLDAARSVSTYLAEATSRRGYRGRVWLSHGCALSSFDRGAQAAIARAIAEARITVICLPATNLYLQDRSRGTPARRGLTAVQELAAAGVEVRFASDNIQDMFYPYGSADMLEAAQLAAVAAHFEDPESLVRAICDGYSEITVGEEASFLLVRGGSLTQVLAERSPERLRVARGAR
jgi:cytosine deaminase